MSGTSDQGAPTRPSLEEYFAAQGAQDAGPDTAPETAASQPAERAPQPTDAATPTQPTQAPAAQPAQQPGETNVDYQARVAELERQIQNREWSSQGRYLQEKARREAAEAEVSRLREGYASEDARIRATYDAALKQTDDPEVRAFLEEKRDLELERRTFQREKDAAAAERAAVEAERQAGQQVTVAQHERTIRTEALPELLRTVDDLVTEFDLPDEEAAALRRVIDTPANRLLVQQAPPKFIGAFVLQTMTHLEQQAREAQGRAVARNREAASAAGTYRGAVDTATAPAQQTTKRDPRVKDIDQLAAFFGATPG